MSIVTLPPDKALAGQTLQYGSVAMQMQVSFCDRYSFYDHIVCTRLLPIEKAATVTRRLRNRNNHIDYGDCVQLTGSIMTRKVKLWSTCLLHHNSAEQHIDFDIVLLHSNRKKARRDCMYLPVMLPESAVIVAVDITLRSASAALHVD